MAENNLTTILNMVVVPEKFSQYVIDRTVELNRMINAGIATPDATVAKLINGTPGRAEDLLKFRFIIRLRAKKMYLERMIYLSATLQLKVHMQHFS